MFNSPRHSLRSLLGDEYIDSLCRSAVFNGYVTEREAEKAASEVIDFLPEEVQRRNIEALRYVGKQVVPAFENTNDGASTDAFARAFHKSMAPLSSRALTRVGEDGRVYFIGKSEHYHASLGHGFGGYRLIENARALGVPNATHNNTRGYITRLLERELVRAANGGCTDEELERILRGEDEATLCRVINLETGSLAVEAGVKIMLARFYKLEASFDECEYAGKTPVFLVMGDRSGGAEANYHGTTVLAQTMRGLWGAFAEKAEAAGLYKTVPVMINDIGDFEDKIKRFNTGEYKTAGFLHEIILMNYGAVCLTPEYLRGAYALCARYDTPTLVDEIQSCMWYDGMFCFRKWGLKPDFAVVGKGFPGGEYPASKLITTRRMDKLNLFGALVTNGQEELASLSYLVTMEFSKANGARITELGERFFSSLERIAAAHGGLIVSAEGCGHCAGLRFTSVEHAARFAGILNNMCIDISAQLYKQHCPPVVLVKPPLTADADALDFLCGKITEALGQMEG